MRRIVHPLIPGPIITLSLPNFDKSDKCDKCGAFKRVSTRGSLLDAKHLKEVSRENLITFASKVGAYEFEQEVQLKSSSKKFGKRSSVEVRFPNIVFRLESPAKKALSSASLVNRIRDLRA